MRRRVVRRRGSSRRGIGAPGPSSRKEHVVEVGRGSKGSIFVKGRSQYQAIREGRTLGGLQIWRIIKHNFATGKTETKTVYLKSRRELREVIEKW